jgi:hypothetical protein
MADIQPLEASELKRRCKTDAILNDLTYLYKLVKEKCDEELTAPPLETSSEYAQWYLQLKIIANRACDKLFEEQKGT